jgi:myosin heavy subunit
LTNLAYCDLRDNSASQSVIISGESGAGKTEATKIVLKYLTVASSGEGDRML